MSEPSDNNFIKMADLLCQKYNQQNRTNFKFFKVNTTKRKVKNISNKVKNDEDVDFYIKDENVQIGIQHKLYAINDFNLPPV